MASAPSMMGALSPASQLAIVSPPAVSRAAAASSGTSVRCTNRPPIRPVMSTTTVPPARAKTGDSPW